jgi:hypothetical protein
VTLEEFSKFIKPLKLRNGWVDLDHPSAYIDSAHSFSIGPGWYSLVANLINELIETGWDKEIHQVKEKFGGLRFYIGYGDDKIYKIISKYESLSYKTCEDCGEEGEGRGDLGWVQTLCDKHYQEELNGRKKIT